MGAVSSVSEMDSDRVKVCREWIARRTAQLDQIEKRYERQYDFVPARVNRVRLEDIEATRFWLDIHRWELEQMIETGVDDYPQKSNND